MKGPNNAEKYHKARASIAAVNLARLGCIGFGLWYLPHGDILGAGICIGLFWFTGWLLPEI
jgi:hypothetical protein